MPAYQAQFVPFDILCSLAFRKLSALFAFAVIVLTARWTVSCCYFAHVSISICELRGTKDSELIPERVGAVREVRRFCTGRSLTETKASVCTTKLRREAKIKIEGSDKLTITSRILDENKICLRFPLNYLDRTRIMF